jgi:hypothetical protein
MGHIDVEHDEAIGVILKFIQALCKQPSMTLEQLQEIIDDEIHARGLH